MASPVDHDYDNLNYLNYWSTGPRQNLCSHFQFYFIQIFWLLSDRLSPILYTMINPCNVL